MVGVYVLLVKKELRLFSSVPSNLKSQVKAELIAQGLEHLIDE